MCTFRAAALAALCLGAHFAVAQGNSQSSGQQTTEASCFRISVDLDDTPVANSLSIYVNQKGHLEKLSQVDGCFRLPASFKGTGKVNVRIDVGQDSLSLPGVSPELLGRPWGIFLSDKTEPVTVGKKHYKASQVCRVVVHGGEPENGFITAPCRSLRRQPRKH